MCACNEYTIFNRLFQKYALEQKYLLEERPERRLFTSADAARMIQGNAPIRIISQSHTTLITARIQGKMA